MWPVSNPIDKTLGSISIQQTCQLNCFDPVIVQSGPALLWAIQWLWWSLPSFPQLPQHLLCGVYYFATAISRKGSQVSQYPFSVIGFLKNTPVQIGIYIALRVCRHTPAQVDETWQLLAMMSMRTATAWTSRACLSSRMPQAAGVIYNYRFGFFILRLGYLVALQYVFRLRAGALLMCGLPCSLHVWLSRGTSGKSRENPRGDCDGFTASMKKNNGSKYDCMPFCTYCIGLPSSSNVVGYRTAQLICCPLPGISRAGAWTCTVHGWLCPGNAAKAVVWLATIARMNCTVYKLIKYP